MDIENYDDIGKTSLFKDLSDDKYDLFLKLLSFENSEFLDVLCKMTDRNTVLQILDVFAGEYLKQKDFSEDAYKFISKEYDRTVYEIKKIVKVIEKNLGQLK